MLEKLLKTKEAALLINVSSKTLERQRWQRFGIPYVRVFGRSVRYRQSVIEAWLKSPFSVKLDENGEPYDI